MSIRLNNFKSEGNKARKRLGRGNSAGQGTTAGRGYNGQKSRSGGYHKVGFEGGQMPLQRRLPKFGFTNFFRKEYAIVNLITIGKLPQDKDITPETLVEYGVIKFKDINRVKILGDGELNSAYNIKAHKFSKTAADKIKAAGGTMEVI